MTGKREFGDGAREQRRAQDRERLREAVEQLLTARVGSGGCASARGGRPIGNPPVGATALGFRLQGV
jgi:hypothetical protein